MRRAGCRFSDKHQRSGCDMCTMYVHGRVVPGVVARSRKALARTSSGKLLATERRLETHQTHLSECRRHYRLHPRRCRGGEECGEECGEGGKVLQI